MAQAQVATPVPDVGKLRPVLDYIPCETCLDMYTPEQDYYCAVCPRLVRDVVVRRTALGTDEAVQVIPPEDFSMAKDLRDRIQQQEVELQEAREKLAALARREADLQSELARLSEDLVRVRKEKDEAQLVPFEFVGVREGQRQEGLMEFAPEEEEQSPDGHAPTALAWEPAPETSAAAPKEWQPVAEEETKDAAPSWDEVPTADEASVEASPPEPAAETPSFEPTERLPDARTSDKPRPMATTDDAIARIEAEIAKIEQELQQVADQEKQLGGEKPAKKRKK